MNKKITQLRWLAATLMLVAAMVMPSTAWADTFTPTKPSNGDGSKESPYQIGTAAELYWFAGLVNGDTNVCDYNADTNPTGTQQNKAACAVLTANITVNSGVLKADGSIADNVSSFRSWTPIGNYNNEYTGTFDGQGYTVSGLYFKDTSKEEVGLFGHLGSGGKISNVGVLDSYFEFRMMGGGICGCNYGEINNCSNGGTVIGNTGSGAGGVCGMNYGTIKDCKNTGSVSGSVDDTGGVCGVIYSGTIENCLNEGAVSGTTNYTGGVCGQANGGEIKWSYNTASVSGVYGVGGVCGYILIGSLEGCHNTGAVSGTTNPNNFFGGVCGENSGTIKNCYNTGNVSVNNVTCIGGVCGENSGTVTSCFNTGLIGTGSFIGGICGKNGVNSSTTNCYYDSNIYSGDAIGYNQNGNVGEDVMGKTTAQFKSGEVAWLLNGSRSEGTEENPLAWYQNISPSSRDLYPVLTGTGTNTVYQVKILCGGTDDVRKAYSNTNKDITVEHILIGPAVFNSGKKIYSKICQREGCGKTFYYADAASTIKATPNAEETAFAVASYTLADANPYDNQAVFTATSLAYKRTFYDDKWMAVYVPFAIDCSKLESDYEMATINNFHEYEQEDGTYNVVLEVKRVTKGGTIPALTPCLMRMKTAPEAEVEKTLTFENAAFSAAADKSIDCSSVTRYYQFTGSLNGKSGLTAGTDFVLSAGKLYNTSENTVLPAQRWYLSATDRTSTSVESATMLRSISIKVIGDGEATGIENIQVNTESGAAALSGTGIYDLQGRKINSEPTKGMYIKNGKKYIK